MNLKIIKKMENNHIPPFYATMPDASTLVIDLGNREFPLPELIGQQVSSRIELNVCNLDDCKICLSIAFGYGFLYRKADKDQKTAILLSIYPLKLDNGEYGVIEKKSGEWARFFFYIKNKLFSSFINLKSKRIFIFFICFMLLSFWN